MLPFILRSLGLRLAGLLLAAIVMLASLPYILPWLKLTERADLVQKYVWVVVAVALMNSAGSALEALLHQRAAQAAAIAYAAVRAALIAWAAWQGELDIEAVVTLDLIAAIVAFAVSVPPLLAYARDSLGTGASGTDVTLWRRFAAYAARNFAGQILMQASGNHAMRLALTGWSGLLETARYGFAMSLSELLQRYLPAALLLRLIRPVFITRYVENRDFEQLNGFANIVLKLNMLMLAPAFAVVLGAGDGLVSVLSGGKYADTQWLLLGVIMLLVSFSHQTVISIVAGTLEENDIQIYAALFALVAVPIAALAVPAQGAYGALGAALVGAIVYNVAAALLLRRRGFAYRIDFRGLSRLFLAGVPAALAAWLVTLGAAALHWPAWATLATAVVACIALFLVTAAKVKGFTLAEQSMIHGLVPRKAFPF